MFSSDIINAVYIMLYKSPEENKEYVLGRICETGEMISQA